MKNTKDKNESTSRDGPELRPPAAESHADEREALARADTDARPPGWKQVARDAGLDVLAAAVDQPIRPRLEAQPRHDAIPQLVGRDAEVFGGNRQCLDDRTSHVLVRGR